MAIQANLPIHPPVKEREPDAGRVQRVAVRGWWTSLALTVIGVLINELWTDYGWYLWMLAGLTLVGFSIAIAVMHGEARALPAVREKAAEVTELRASRGRLVDASDAARRAIERDLHDGVQPRLVALLLNVGMARRAGQLEGAPAVIDDIEHELSEILRDIRALASGILPPALTDLGSKLR